MTFRMNRLTSSIFPEDGGGNFLRNVADYTLEDLTFDKKRLSLIDTLL
jgi:hypothetical protein